MEASYFLSACHWWGLAIWIYNYNYGISKESRKKLKKLWKLHGMRTQSRFTWSLHVESFGSPNIHQHFCYIPWVLWIFAVQSSFCERHCGIMVTMPDSSFSKLGFGPGCSHRVKTVLWFWARLLTLAVSLSNHVHVQLGYHQHYVFWYSAMD